MSAIGVLRTVEGGRLGFRCPGCGHTHVIPVEGERAWGWNGSYDKPTFTPSILATYDHWVPPYTPENRVRREDQKQVRDICHSFVTDGRIQFLGDCTQELAGQTVALASAG